jgi:hypothetical protein
MMATRTRIRAAVNVYTALLWLYPRAHREAYGALMIQLFRDQCNDAYALRGVRGLLTTCFRTLLDLAVTIVQEHLRVAADAGLTNDPVTPLPWGQVGLAILPGVLIMVERVSLVSWGAAPLPAWTQHLNVHSWLWTSAVLIAWSLIRYRRIVPWAYPAAGIVASQLGSYIPHLALMLVLVGGLILWQQHHRLRASVFTWIAVGALVAASLSISGLLGSLAVVIILLPGTLGLTAVSRDRLYATLLVTGLIWWFVDTVIDPAYGLLIYTDATSTVRTLRTLPALFTVVLPVLGVLRARRTFEQLVTVTLVPFIGIVLMEVVRLALLLSVAYPLRLTGWTAALGSAVQVAAALALVAITYAHYDSRPIGGEAQRTS